MEGILSQSTSGSSVFLEKHPQKTDHVTYYRTGETENSSDHDWKRVVTPPKRTKTFKDLVFDLLAAIFLPRGYPDSVSADYLTFQTWDSLQAFGSMVTSTLATHNILKGIGVGDESASVMSATLTWLLKDGTGMLGRIGFTYLRGSSLDIDCKRWRLTAEFIVDMTIAIDMASPHFSGYIMFIQCFTGFFKSVVATIVGGTRAALTQHQARQNNLGDVSSKDASQETLCNLTALIASLIIMPIVGDSEKTIWSLFILLTIFHIYCNYRAVRSVNMEVFNSTRLALFIQSLHFSNSNDPGRCSIGSINRRENVWFFNKPGWNKYVQAGVPLSFHVKSAKQLAAAFRNFSSSDYLLTFDPFRESPVYISFFEGKDSTHHKLKALFHAYFLYFHCTPEYLASTLASDSVNDHTDLGDYILTQTRTKVDLMFSDFLNTAQNNHWSTTSLLFLEDGWRLTSVHDKID